MVKPTNARQMHFEPLVPTSSPLKGRKPFRYLFTLSTPNTSSEKKILRRLEKVHMLLGEMALKAMVGSAGCHGLERWVLPLTLVDNLVKHKEAGRISKKRKG